MALPHRPIAATGSGRIEGASLDGLMWLPVWRKPTWKRTSHSPSTNSSSEADRTYQGTGAGNCPPPIRTA